MGKVRHRKRTRDARVQATQLPLTGSTSSADAAQHQDAAATAAAAGMKKGARRDADMAQLLDQLKSQDGRERTMASATLAGLVLSLPPLQLRLLLSKNLIGQLIERVAALPEPAAGTSAPPPSHDLATAIESLGALRNLAVSGPTHLLSEMHNKRMLQPLVAVHLPLLTHFLPGQLGPAPSLVKPAMPATACARRAAEDANEANDTLRRSFWDWAENTLTLLWCLAESNTKILASLNQHAQAIVGLCVAFLQHAVDVDLEGTTEGTVDAASKGKGKQQPGARKSRVPLYVAVAAAQTLHAFVSSNPAAHSQLLSPPGSYTFSPSLSILLSVLSSPSPPSAPAPASVTSPAAADAAEEWAQLRVLAFGILLEIAKGRSKRRDVETVREHLRSDEAQEVLLELVREADLSKAVEEGKAVAGQIDPAALPSRATDSSSPNARLASLERRAQTLQLALEVLSEWLASGVPNSALLANAGEIDGDGMMDDGDDDVGGDEDEEEWGGAAMDVEDGDEVMGGDDDEDGEQDDVNAAGIKQEQDGVIRRRRGDTPEAVARRMAGAAADDGDSLDDDAMLDDLAATADSDAEDLVDADEAAAATTNTGSVLLAASLPMQLLALSRPSTELSFIPSTAFAEVPAAAAAKGTGNGLIATSVATANPAGSQQPAALSTLSEAVTTIHVRAIEALNNLYVTLSRGKKARRDPKELQEVFETALGLVQGALEAAAAAASTATPASHVPAPAKKGKAAGGGSGTAGKQPEEEVDEVQERRREVVMAGMGVVWGCAILGLDPERNGKMVVGPDTTPFLIQHVYPSAFAAAQTPAGEAIRVRTLGALGWIGRRQGASSEENATIGRFMLSLLPVSRAAVVSNSVPSTVAATPDILLEAIDSFIDLYADEERDYDVPVFRQGGMLDELERSVQGVRAAIKKIDKSKYPDLRARADGNLNNLVAFVQYRKDILKARAQ